MTKIEWAQIARRVILEDSLATSFRHVLIS